MALVDAATFKTQLATAAAAITVAFEDDTITGEMASEIQYQNHPLRNMEQFFSVHHVTGVVSANDSYVDQAYAGGYPPSLGRIYAKNADINPVLVSAVVEAAFPDIIFLTYDVPLMASVNPIAGDFTTSGGTPVVGIKVDIQNRTLAIQVDADFVFGNVILLSYTRTGTPARSTGGALLEDFVDQAVTNNVPA